MKAFEEALFLGELNRFVGSGGELLIKGSKGANSSSTQMDVGDRLIGIGVTHIVESLSRPPGLDSFHALGIDANVVPKIALRGFEVIAKQETPSGFDFRFAPLPPEEYSSLVEQVSEGAVRIPAQTIPKGTIILSFLDSNAAYTLRNLANSPSENWIRATTGERHWNVGIGQDMDFWVASFPSDQVGLLNQFPSYMKVGTINFGLSLLSGSNGAVNLEPIECPNPGGGTSKHDFCLNGYAMGTQHVDTPFPIGLRTEIMFHPISLT
jgi:hypothetical protein